jgi:hypothetical protein
VIQGAKANRVLWLMVAQQSLPMEIQLYLINSWPNICKILQNNTGKYKRDIFRMTMEEHVFDTNAGKQLS